MGICGGRPGMPGGVGTSRTGNTASTLMWPLASTLSRSLPPASATSRTPGRASSPLGSLSISRPGWAPAPLSGLLAASKVGKSATNRTVWPVTRSSRPKASAPGPNCWRVCGPPNGPLTSTYCLAPVSETSDGPSAKLPPAWATDGRPPAAVAAVAVLARCRPQRGLWRRRCLAAEGGDRDEHEQASQDARPPQQLVHGDQLLARLGLVRSPRARSRRDLCGPFRAGPPSTPTVPGPSLVSDTTDEPYRSGWWWPQ